MVVGSRLSHFAHGLIDLKPGQDQQHNQHTINNMITYTIKRNTLDRGFGSGLQQGLGEGLDRGGMAHEARVTPGRQTAGRSHGEHA